MASANRRVNSAHVLLLDARERERIRYADILRDAGFLVTALTDSEETFRLAGDSQPRVIVAAMTADSRADCLALCRRLKADPRTRTIPTLLASPTMGDEDIRLATAVGVLALTVSPNNGAKLVSAIRGVLAVDEREQPHTSAADSENVRRSA